MDKLADELLKEILSPPLRVSDDMFADPGVISPFSRATSSASDVLLVCKRFMRVGTPALYETVVIRSTAQAQALQMALTRNPEFGRFVKKLRLEAVYGQYFTTAVVDVLTRVTDFCFTLSAYTVDKMAGLYKALVKFDPVRVILTLHDRVRARNAQHRALVDKLCTAVTKWTKLERFSFYTCDDYHRRDVLVSNKELASALGMCKTLQTVDVFLSSHDTVSAEVLLTSSNNCKLVLHFQDNGKPYSSTMSTPSELKNRVFIVSSSSTRLRALNEFDSRDAPTVSTSLNPFYSPMRDAPRDVRLRIWGRIFFFSVDPLDDASRYARRFIWNAAPPTQGTAQAILSVSRDFYDAVLPILIHDLNIRSSRSYDTWLRRLDSDRFPNLGASARTLEMQNVYRGSNSPPKKLFKRLSSLEEACFFGLVSSLFDGLPTLGSTAGKTLQKLSLREYTSYAGESPYSLSVFADCTALTELTIEGEKIRFTAAEKSSVFPNLRILDAYKVNGSFFTALCKASLPSLRTCRIRQGVKRADRFLKQHGGKLRTLCVTTGIQQAHIQAMTSLQVLDLYDDVQVDILSTLNSRSVQELRLNWDPTGFGVGLGKFQAMSYRLSASRFPALKKVVVAATHEIWPASERDIKKNPWPEMAARLARSGIVLVDHSGRSWRPRLQVR